MPVNAQRGYMRLLRIAEHSARVVGTSWRSPWLRRIRFFAPTLVEAFDGHPGEWIRLWVPDHSRGGLLRQRGYTVADSSYEGGWFDIDVVLHSPDGPASAWARAVRPGEEALVSFSRTKEHLGGDEPLTLLADLSSLPAVESICLHTPSTRPVQVFLDAQGHSLEGVLNAPGALVTLTDNPVEAWLAQPEGGTAIAASGKRGETRGAVTSLEHSPDTAFVWAGLERGRTSALRSALRSAGHPRALAHAQAYWIAGRAFA